MNDPRDGAPEGRSSGGPEEAPPRPDEPTAEISDDEDVVEADISEDITAPQPTIDTRVEGAGAAGTTVAAEPAAPARRPMRPDERRAARRPTAAPAPRPSEQAVHIEDRASRLFVLASIAIFAAILLNGLLGGQGGPLAPKPTPVPSVSASPSASVAPSPSPSGSPPASPSASSATDGGSPAASGATSASPASP